ncbi:uncharacterized protein LOC131876971 [Tigriopus californicus]|uniref:uncharacterized protein LOC131876971 n=1 Tax=Tigriopus californicus TaxID=6832 RepID=UPI0027DA4075|nr:uncharacterized protein LOC131876971 [Tigriopus californicus]
MNRVVILALILGVSGNLGHPMESPSASSAFLSKTNKYQTSEPAPRILGRNRDNGDDEEVDRAKRSSGSTVPLVVFQNGVPTIVKHDDGTPVMLGEDDQNNIEVTKREAEQAETTEVEIPILAFNEDGQPMELLNDDGTPVIYKENQNRQKRSFNEDFFDDFVELGGDEHAHEFAPDFHRKKREAEQAETTEVEIPILAFNEDGQPMELLNDDGTPVIYKENQNRQKRSFNEDFFDDFVELGGDEHAHEFAPDFHRKKREAEQAETTEVEIPILAFNEDGQPIELLNDDGTPVVYKENQNRQKRSFNEDFFDDFVELGGDEFSFGTPNFHRTKRDTIQTTTGIPLVVFQDGQLKVVKKSDGSPLTIEEAEGLAGNKARVKRSPGRKGRRGGKRGRVNISIEEHVFVLKPTHGHGHGGYGHHHGHGHDHHFGGFF